MQHMLGPSNVVACGYIVCVLVSRCTSRDRNRLCEIVGVLDCNKQLQWWCKVCFRATNASTGQNLTRRI